MATTFVKNGTNVLVTIGGNDPISAPGNAFITPHPDEADVIMISEKFDPQGRDKAIKIYVSDVTLPVNSGRSDLIVKLSTDFFFRVATGETEEATDSFYTEAEVDNLTYNRNRIKKDLLYLSGISYLFPVGQQGLMSGGTAMTAGTGYYSAYICDETKTYTSACIQFLTAQANYTGDAAKYNGIVVFRVNMSTFDLTEIARTTNDTEFWKGTISSFNVKNFAATFNVTKGDVLLVACLYNSTAQVTAVTLGTVGTIHSNLYLGLNNFRITASKAALSDFSNVNMSTLSTGSTCYGVLLK